MFYLKRNAPRKDGTVPVMARITIDGTISQFSCKIDIDPKMWDPKSGRATGRSEQAQQFNRYLDRMRVNINRHYRETVDRDVHVTAEKVKNAFLGLDMRCETLLKVYERHNEDFSGQVDAGLKTGATLSKYEAVYSHLKDFISYKYNRSDMALKELAPAFITDFELYLRTEKKLSHNTVYIYMMPLRRMVAIAIKNRWLRYDPFVDYIIAPEETDRGFLTNEEIKMMMNMKFRRRRQELVRDMFIFCCFTGLSFIDLKGLKKENLQTSFDGHPWINIHRQKTNVPSTVRLLDIPLKIIRKYEGLAKNNRLLPVPNYDMACENIKRIAGACGITKNVTWHLSRHTYATAICMTNGISMESLSKMLGHKNIKTTQIYAKVTNEKIGMEMEALSLKLQNSELFPDTAI